VSIIVIAGLLLGSPIAGDAHQVQVEHRGTPVDVTYRSDVRIAHRQVGAVGAPGRPSALRCTWAASVDVHRELRHPAGHVSARQISSDAVAISGSRPGWCEASRQAIAQDVAAERARLRSHVEVIAAADRDAVLAELDTVSGGMRS